MKTIPDGPWLGSWKLVRDVGFEQWLLHRGSSPDEAASNVDSLMNHTVLRIDEAGGAVVFEWSTKVRGRLRRTRIEVRYSLDGVTPTVLDGPTGPVSFTARVDGEDLVHTGGPLSSPTETHRRRVVDGRMIQTMKVDGAGDEDGLWCELIWERA